MNFRPFPSLLLTFLSIQMFGQTVNIESRRMQTDSLRFAMIGDVSTSYSNNDGLYIFEVGTNITTQFKSKSLKKIYFLVGDYKLIRSEDQDFQNSWFLHFRYNQKITDLFRIEGFVQSQENQVLDVNTRNLLGLGVRFKISIADSTRLYLGHTYMYEIEKSNELNQDFKNSRYSTYISLTLPITSTLSIINTLYYQPLLKDFGDHRILEQFKLDATVSEKVNVFATFSYLFDSLTPRGRQQYSASTSFGIGLKF